jgi:hypothetical protein
MADKPFCLLTAEIEYTAPIRLPFSNNGVFLSDGLPMLVRLYLPLFYSGRLLLRTSFMRAPRLPSVEIKLIKVELYNREHQRRTVDLSSFYRDANGRFISPILFLQ